MYLNQKEHRFALLLIEVSFYEVNLFQDYTMYYYQQISGLTEFYLAFVVNFNFSFSIGFGCQAGQAMNSSPETSPAR